MTHEIINYSGSYSNTVYKLGIIHQSLIERSLNLGLVADTNELKELDNRLKWLLEYKSSSFNFVSQIAEGNTLLIGEGNLSFTRSLIKKTSINSTNLTATTFELANDLSLDADANSEYLKTMGVRVIHGVDATNLSKVFNYEKFNSIVFQFPNAGSREPIEGRNPNFILVRDFLISAVSLLSFGGCIMISVVDSPYYEGAFSLDEAAEAAGFNLPSVYKFDPTKFSGYEHTMTHQEGSALDNYDDFCTWVFRLKQ